MTYDERAARLRELMATVDSRHSTTADRRVAAEAVLAEARAWLAATGDVAREHGESS